MLTEANLYMFFMLDVFVDVLQMEVRKWRKISYQQIVAFSNLLEYSDSKFLYHRYSHK